MSQYLRSKRKKRRKVRTLNRARNNWTCTPMRLSARTWASWRSPWEVSQFLNANMHSWNFECYKHSGSLNLVQYLYKINTLTKIWFLISLIIQVENVYDIMIMSKMYPCKLRQRQGRVVRKYISEGKGKKGSMEKICYCVIKQLFSQKYSNLIFLIFGIKFKSRFIW